MSLRCYVNRSFEVRDRNGRTESGNTGGIKGEGKNKKVNLVKAKTNPDSTCPQGEDPSPRSTDTRDTSYHDTCDLMGGWMITWLHAHKELRVTSAAFFFQTARWLSLLS